MQPTPSPEGPPLRSLDDLEVGLKFKSKVHAIDTEQMIAFAKLYDPQPFHTDPDLAKASLFGGLVASGWFTAAVNMRLLLEALPLTNGTIGLSGEQLAFPKPLRPGASVYLEGEVVGIKESRSQGDRGIVTIRAETKTQNNDIVFACTANLLVFRYVKK
jgi:acyl dehydratase